ncbi:MAG: helix-turn-helix domain-containing protein [Deltaproteobacteria bacterium]|nr:MAG: helix-turn-helix domain-containing protein [Deltaproteobacteria bacterium]
MLRKLVGAKLKKTRLKRDLTIQELATASRVSANMISRIERGLTTPSVEILMRLATAFGLSIGYFVEEAEKGADVVLTRKGEGRPVFFFVDKHQIVDLTQGVRDPGFSVFIDTLEKGCDSGAGGMVQSGEEFAYVLEGQLEFVIADEVFLLGAGDSIAFKAAQPHRWVNRHDDRTVVLWVVSPAPHLK